MLESVLGNLISFVQQPSLALLMLVGTIVGIVMGAIPGLTATMAVALFLPFTFGMSSFHGLSLLIAVYIGGISGGLIGASLLGIPGTPSSVATTFDAYPLVLKGQPVKALGTGIIASFIGGTLGLIVLMLVAPLVANIALNFTPYEYFSLSILALTLICVLSKGQMLKGILAGLLGMMVSMVGLAPICSTARFTLGQVSLNAGLTVLPVLVGLFAIPQVLHDVCNPHGQIESDVNISGFGITIQEIKQNLTNILRSFLIGFGIGVLPGMGGGTSNLIAYAQAKQSSKHPEEFGKGCVDGIWTSETANNASVAGALVPLLTLGIPGDTVTAMLLGGLMIHGLQPGPLLFTTNPEVIYGIYAAYLVATLLVLALQYGGMRLFPRILTLPSCYLYPMILAMTMVGAFANNNRIFDIWVMLFFGLLGVLMNMAKIPTPPMILGFIIGPTIETNLRRGLMLSSGNPLPFLVRPISGILLAVAVLSVVSVLFHESKTTRRSIS